METLNRKIRLLFWFSLGLSIGFPLGVLGIVFGAVKGIVLLLVLGIVLTVSGFYGMPLLWVKYAERRGDRNLLLHVENEKIDTVSGLAAQTGRNEADIRATLVRLIHTHILVGYIFKDDTLIPNQKKEEAKKKKATRRPCECCGAAMLLQENQYVCPYCGNTAAE